MSYASMSYVLCMHCLLCQHVSGATLTYLPTYLPSITTLSLLTRFPASSPYVTSVGATQGPESGTPEIACTSGTDGVITTGGGFSADFAAPAYQTAAIDGYFAGLGTKTPVGGYNAGGRGYPDVAMAGAAYEVVVGGQTYQVRGSRRDWICGCSRGGREDP
jgi:hypothetical protein